MKISHDLREIAPSLIDPVARPNVGVRFSKAKNNVCIVDRDQVFEDILMQGEDMAHFLSELKQMADLPIGDAIAAAAAPFIASKWS